MKKNLICLVISLVFVLTSAYARPFLVSDFATSSTNTAWWGDWTYSAAGGGAGASGAIGFTPGVSDNAILYTLSVNTLGGWGYSHMRIDFRGTWNITNVAYSNYANRVTNISFSIKGTGGVHIKLILATPLSAGSNSYASYAYDLGAVGPTWTNYIIPFSAFSWTGGAGGVYSLKAAIMSCQGFKWEDGTLGESGSIALDNVYFNGTQGILLATNINPLSAKSLIDDFSTSNPPTANQWGVWERHWGSGNNDATGGTLSTEVERNGPAMKYAGFSTGTGSYSYNHIYLNFMTPLNLPSYKQTNISFWYRKSGSINMRLLIATPLMGSSNNNSSWSYDLTTPGTNWKFFNIPFSEFYWPGPTAGKYTLEAALQNCNGLKWEDVAAGESGTFWLDDVYMVGSPNDPGAVYALIVPITNANPAPVMIKAEVYNTLVDLPNGGANPLVKVDVVSATKQKVAITVYTSSGRKVRSLVTGSEYSTGSYSVPWDLADDGGAQVAAGVYIIHVAMDGYKKSFKVMVLR